MNFSTFKIAVAKQFERMQKHPMFRVDIEKDAVWNTYLDSYPAGTNEIYRVRAENDCGCCKQFIRAVGDVVAIIDGEVVSIWDIGIAGVIDDAYVTVAAALSELILSKPIKDEFLHYEKSAGTDKNFEQMVSGVKTWEHFHVNIKPAFVMKKADIATALSEIRSTHDVMLRSLNEITSASVDTFRTLQKEFSKLKTAEEKDIFVWKKYHDVPTSVAKIRSTAIGSLLVDLSKGEDLEGSVASFEAKVAPTNYKRPTALITKAMIEKAKTQLSDMGLTSALERRYANIHDITVNNILFADKEARNTMADHTPQLEIEDRGGLRCPEGASPSCQFLSPFRTWLSRPLCQNPPWLSDFRFVMREVRFLCSRIFLIYSSLCDHSRHISA